ncbi:MAG: CopD family protein [Pseudohongiellaceae bacterium]
MIWLLVVHIMAILIWCASLLFLQRLTAVRCPSRQEPGDALPSPEHDSVVRLLFTRVSTPVALLGIISGTWVFLLQGNVDLWLIVKLSLVLLLVICHTASGALILRVAAGKNAKPWSDLLTVLSTLLMLAIVWTVLAKPGRGELLWI